MIQNTNLLLGTVETLQRGLQRALNISLFTYALTKANKDQRTKPSATAVTKWVCSPMPAFCASSEWIMKQTFCCVP